MYTYNESLPLLFSQYWLISVFSLFSSLILIVSSDTESAGVTISTSPSAGISTTLYESISWVDLFGYFRLYSLFYTTSGFVICRPKVR